MDDILAGLRIGAPQVPNQADAPPEALRPHDVNFLSQISKLLPTGESGKGAPAGAAEGGGIEGLIQTLAGLLA